MNNDNILIKLHELVGSKVRVNGSKLEKLKVGYNKDSGLHFHTKLWWFTDDRVDFINNNIIVLK